jgi:hypothetical protein
LKISALVEEHLDVEQSTGNLTDDGQAHACGIEAARMYAGFGVLTDPTVTDLASITGDTVLDVSEWAVIKPLFRLYLERESAKVVETSRGMGVEMFGRDTSTVAADIAQYERDLQKLAFEQEPWSIIPALV